MKNKTLDPKTYFYIKYFFTIFCFLGVILALMPYFYLKKEWLTSEILYKKITWVIFGFQIFFIALFLYLKLNISKKTGYKNAKSDWIWIGIFLVLISIILIISMIFIIDINNFRTNFITKWSLALVSIFLLTTLASIAELLSRFKEYSKVAYEYEIEARKRDSDLIKEKIDSKQIDSIEEVFKE